MKATRLVALLLAVLLSAALAKPVQFTTTIDYLDYVFYDRIGPQEYYSLESYEQRIREMAEMGFTQINLRTNCMGMGLHPSKLLPRYGEGGRWHYTERGGAMRLIETLKHYDPLAETIRLGHKYGMQVWCWENICDESFQWDEAGIKDPEGKAACRKYDGWPMLDPFLAAHPECWAMLKTPTAEERKRRLEEARKYPVARMVVTAYATDRPPINFGKDDLEILTSEDNVTYVKYTGPWSFSCGRDKEGHNYIEIKDLQINARYIKIAPVKGFDLAKHPWTLTLKGRDFGQIYNTKGERIYSDWGCHIPGMNTNQPEKDIVITPDYHQRSVLEFDRVPSMGFDARDRQIGCAVGGAARNTHFKGMLEFCNPVAMKRRLDRFQEYADYPFDGYIMSMNCHSNNSNADEYSYNPAVRERILKRLGKDILKDDVPKEELIRERQAGLSEFIEACKKKVGGRPVFVEGWGPDWRRGGLYGRDNYGSIVPDYPRLIQNGTVSGVLMYHDFASYFTPQVTGGRPVKLGMYYDLNAKVFFAPAGQKNLFPGDFAAALKWYAAQGKFDLIDLYETVVLSHDAKMQEAVRANTGK